MTEPVDDTTAANAAKRAVHVKWQGKTIALGTFPSTEAEEKCAKAKALTRAWRSSMRPKPTRDWVINELERLGIRVVSGGRTSRKGEEEGILTSNVAPGSQPNTMMLMAMNNANANQQMNGSMSAQQQQQQQVNMPQNAWNQQDAQNNNLKQARRSSSLGLSLLSNEFGKNNSFHNATQPSANNSANNMDLLGKPAFRELVGGGAAAAYNAYRDDFYRQQPADQGTGENTNNGVGNMGSSSINNIANTTATNPNEHYQMLKLHHMNLLNEIQETTLMMNIYQQQHLQQQQLLLQQQQSMASLQGGGNQMNMLLSMQQNVGGMANLQQMEQNGMNLGQTHLIPSEPQNNESAPQQQQQQTEDKRRIEDALNENGAKRQKMEGNGVVTYGV